LFSRRAQSDSLPMAGRLNLRGHFDSDEDLGISRGNKTFPDIRLSKKNGKVNLCVELKKISPRLCHMSVLLILSQNCKSLFIDFSRSYKCAYHGIFRLSRCCNCEVAR